MGFGGKSSTKSNTEVYLTFHLKVRASHLIARIYSQYQQCLYQEITGFRVNVWTFTKIAEWLNDNEYSTARNKKLNSSHVNSILNKRSILDQRLCSKHRI